ncbi:MAG: CCA tRNA nucleotidyltransferase [Pseudomonadota bacterium]
MEDPKTTLAALSPEAAAGFRWIAEPPASTAIAALEAARSGAARFVGGCVRDGLIGVAAKDVDIATQLSPEDTLAALGKAGIRAEPTGVEHGTVTAVIDGVGIEITSLRADVETDGRRAVVTFTDDWALDAIRRDFTMNALYLTPDLRLYDPWGGARDLENGRVRFIGDADARIREDYLRILRFFRFSARFAKGPYDADGFAACAALSEGVARLSRERIGQELTRILEGPNAYAAIREMVAAGVLKRVWPDDPDIEAFVALMRVWPHAPAAIGLAALWPQAALAKSGEGIVAALRLSNADGARMSAAVDNANAVNALPDAAAIRRFAYGVGVSGARDALRLAEAQGRISDAGKLETALDGWAPPRLPIAGGDLVAAGVSAGPEVGIILRRIEARWVEEDFPDLARARTIMADELARA